MNKEEIKHFKSLLRQGSLRHMNILLDDKFQKELLNIIKDYEKLQNNWNELKEWLKTRINTDKDYERHSHIKEKLQVEDYVIKQVMFYMEELESRK